MVVENVLVHIEQGIVFKALAALVFVLDSSVLSVDESADFSSTCVVLDESVVNDVNDSNG